METIGSLIACTAPSSAGSIWSVGTWILWWSVSNSAANGIGVAKFVSLPAADVLKADAERLQALLARTRQQSHDQAGVKSTGQQTPTGTSATIRRSTR